MIQQHFIRSPSLREKLNDRYAGVELATGEYTILYVCVYLKEVEEEEVKN